MQYCQKKPRRVIFTSDLYSFMHSEKTKRVMFTSDLRSFTHSPTLTSKQYSTEKQSLTLCHQTFLFPKITGNSTFFLCSFFCFLFLASGSEVCSCEVLIMRLQVESAAIICLISHSSYNMIYLHIHRQNHLRDHHALIPNPQSHPIMFQVFPKQLCEMSTASRTKNHEMIHTSCYSNEISTPSRTKHHEMIHASWRCQNKMSIASRTKKWNDMHPGALLSSMKHRKLVSDPRFCCFLRENTAPGALVTTNKK